MTRVPESSPECTDLENPDAAIAAPAPPSWCGFERGWIISRYADIVSVLRTRAVRSADPGIELSRFALRAGRRHDDLQAVLAGTQLFQDGDRHRRTRMMVRRFVAELRARWTPDRMRETMALALSDVPLGSVVDIVPALADRLSGTIIADALGLEFEHVRRLRHDGHAVMALWRPAPPARDYARLDTLCRHMHDGLAAHAAPGGSLSCLHTGDDADTVSDLAFWLATSGGDSVTGTFAAALDIVARDQAMQERLRRAPGLISGFVREVLRLAGPLRRLTRRIATAPIRLGETTVRPGEGMILHIERAHRDPGAFVAPDCLDPTRTAPPLLAFGGGAHACQGSELGVLQAEMMIEAVLAHVSVHGTETRGRLLPQRDLRQFASLPLRLLPLDHRNRSGPA